MVQTEDDFGLGEHDEICRALVEKRLNNGGAVFKGDDASAHEFCAARFFLDVIDESGRILLEPQSFGEALHLKQSAAREFQESHESGHGVARQNEDGFAADLTETHGDDRAAY